MCRSIATYAGTSSLLKCCADIQSIDDGVIVDGRRLDSLNLNSCKTPRHQNIVANYVCMYIEWRELKIQVPHKYNPFALNEEERGRENVTAHT